MVRRTRRAADGWRAHGGRPLSRGARHRSPAGAVARGLGRGTAAQSGGRLGPPLVGAGAGAAEGAL
ncbi:MAG: hypothetical protein D6807_03780 [Alphaproteobacteria bacterium]|nr:MAG: hypothetical protein D6807_03780 [Alphaproteobacteria bacterium]